MWRGDVLMISRNVFPPCQGPDTSTGKSVESRQHLKLQLFDSQKNHGACKRGSIEEHTRKTQQKQKQNKTKRNKQKKNKTKQNKTKQNKTKQNKTKQKQQKHDLYISRFFDTVGLLRYHIIIPTISYHIIDIQSHHYHHYHIISYHIISYHIISYHIISYHVITSYQTLFQYHQTFKRIWLLADRPDAVMPVTKVTKTKHSTNK